MTNSTNRSPDHPHARGENSGRPPHDSASSDHPHARGENDTEHVEPRPSADHPHARGENDRRRVKSHDASRTIPTHVGRTVACS